MKKTTLTILSVATLFISCNSKSKLEQQKEIASKNIIQYLNANIPASERSNISIDSFRVESIDTLTEKKAIIVKLEGINREFEAAKEVMQNNKTLLVSAQSLKFDSYMIDEYRLEYEKSINNVKSLYDQYENFNTYKEKADDKKYKCHLIKGTAFFTEKMSIKSLQMEIPANDNFIVIQPKDL